MKREEILYAFYSERQVRVLELLWKEGPQLEEISRQAPPMLWDYIEMSPIEHPSRWNVIADGILANIEHCNSFQNSPAILPQPSPTYASDEEDGDEEI